MTFTVIENYCCAAENISHNDSSIVGWATGDGQELVDEFLFSQVCLIQYSPHELLPPTVCYKLVEIFTLRPQLKHTPHVSNALQLHNCSFFLTSFQTSRLRVQILVPKPKIQCMAPNSVVSGHIIPFNRPMHSRVRNDERWGDIKDLS